MTTYHSFLWPWEVTGHQQLVQFLGHTTSCRGMATASLSHLFQKNF